MALISLRQLLDHAAENDYGMPAFAKFAASTYMDFATTGESDPSYCGETEEQ